MSELSLVLSEKFTEDDALSIRTALSQHLHVGKPVFLLRHSIDPPSVIQLLGTAVMWLPLVTAATAFAKSFFSTVGGNRKPHTLVVGRGRAAFHDVGEANSEGAQRRCTDGRRGCC